MAFSSFANENFPQPERREHHNELERRRRDHIKDSFDRVKEAIPGMDGQKASRSQVLKRACDYVETMHESIEAQEADIERMKQRNRELQAESEGHVVTDDVAVALLENAGAAKTGAGTSTEEK